MAIGSYASAGASFGPCFLWTAPATSPTMYAVLYLSSKLGQVTGQGLFSAINDHYSRWLLWPILIGVLIGNTIEAGADPGGMAAAINLFVPLPIPMLVTAIGSTILALQIFGSYKLIRNAFRWFALALLAYVGSAIVAKPDLAEMLSGTSIPRIQFTAEFFGNPGRGDRHDLVRLPLHLMPLLLILLMTNNRALMGERVNSGSHLRALVQGTGRSTPR